MTGRAAQRGNESPFPFVSRIRGHIPIVHDSERIETNSSGQDDPVAGQVSEATVVTPCHPPRQAGANRRRGPPSPLSPFVCVRGGDYG